VLSNRHFSVVAAVPLWQQIAWKRSRKRESFESAMAAALTCSAAVVSLPLMLEAIEKLLVLQDRDRKIRRIEAELAHIEPERQSLKSKTSGAIANLEAGKQRVRQIESDRKRLELDVDAKQQQIAKYANQQLQTRKNEEYKALAHEIDTCKADITKIEDQEIVLMEQAEVAQKDLVRLNREADEAKKHMDSLVAELGAREQNLQKELAALQSDREQLASAVDEVARSRYDRLIKSKGENVLVGVNHGVCGGCHMKLPAQTLVACQADQELVTCINCGRILYYTRDMALAGTD
jgi:predicted  nucleic acid-binding Zn-ribbon protein